MKYLSLAVLVLVFLAGCSQGQKIYDDPNAVSIYLYDDPEITESSYSVEFRFQYSHKDATHAIQKINWNWREGAGIKSFRTYYGKLPQSQRDHHHKENLTYEKRTMTVMAGKVIGADETFNGFAMLPSDWPKKFNEKYLAGHVVRGQITDIYPETATQYTLEFNRGELTFTVIGTDIEYVWTATDPAGASK